MSTRCGCGLNRRAGPASSRRRWHRRGPDDLVRDPAHSRCRRAEDAVGQPGRRLGLATDPLQGGPDPDLWRLAELSQHHGAAGHPRPASLAGRRRGAAPWRRRHHLAWRRHTRLVPEHHAADQCNQPGAELFDLVGLQRGHRGRCGLVGLDLQHGVLQYPDCDRQSSFQRRLSDQVGVGVLDLYVLVVGGGVDHDFIERQIADLLGQ